MKKRFNSDVSTLEEAIEYYTNRSIQMLNCQWSWDGKFKEIDGGIEITFIHEEQGEFKSALIFKQNVGKGFMKKYFQDNPGLKFVSGPMCKKMKSWLDYQDVEYMCFEPHLTSEYLSVQRHYGDTKAQRSNNYYMNHIDEGIYIIRYLGQEGTHDIEDTCRAFCLHPLMQDDAEFLKCKPLAKWSTRALMLSMEYRHVANSFLPKHMGIREPPVSVLHPEVALMLKADKIQNRKDFEIYVTPVESKEKIDLLRAYFDDWFRVLNISEVNYRALVSDIQSKTGR